MFLEKMPFSQTIPFSFLHKASKLRISMLALFGHWRLKRFEFQMIWEVDYASASCLVLSLV